MSPPTGGTYEEHLPSPRLAHLVECYWTFRGVTPAAARPRLILPDGCSDVLFNLGDSTRVDDRGRPDRFVVGAMTRAARVVPSGAVDMMGVRFRPGGAAPFTDVPACEITDGYVDLDVAWGAAGRRVWQRLCESKDTAPRLEALELALLARLKEGRRPDPVVLRAGALLTGEVGRPTRGRRWAVSVAEVAERLNVSRRHLERRFREHVGLTPAQLRKVARLRRAAALIAHGVDTLGAAAVRAGYHDHAHMGRDFQSLAGVSPGAYRDEIAAP